VRGDKEARTTTPLDMAVRNEMDRFHRVADLIDRVPKLGRPMPNRQRATNGSSMKNSSRPAATT